MKTVFGVVLGRIAGLGCIAGVVSTSEGMTQGTPLSTQNLQNNLNELYKEGLSACRNDAYRQNKCDAGSPYSISLTKEGITFFLFDFLPRVRLTTENLKNDNEYVLRIVNLINDIQSHQGALNGEQLCSKWIELQMYIHELVGNPGLTEYVSAQAKNTR